MSVKHGCPRRQQSQNLEVLHFDPAPTPRAWDVAVKCEEPIDELTVQVWLLYDHPNFEYCTLFVSETEYRKDRRTIRLLDAPGRLFKPGA